MNQYYKNFETYRQFLNLFGDLPLSSIYEILKMSDSVNEADYWGKATIVLGLSGNGKSTYINNIKDENNSIVVSMDEVYKTIYKEFGNVNPEMVIYLFGNKLYQAYIDKKDVIVDGNFLNLFTRLSLIDTLHSYGYKVCGVDLLALSDELIKYRIMDEASAYMNININELNVNEYEDNPDYIFCKEHVLSFRQKERESSNIDEQLELGLIDYRLDEYVKVSSFSKKLVK